MVVGELMLNLIVVQFIIVMFVVYEFIEWGVVLVVDQDFGMVYFGIQGDVWDVYKDVLLVLVGVIVSVVVVSVWWGRCVYGCLLG